VSRPDGSIFKFTNPSGKTVWKIEVVIGTSPNGRPRKVRRTAHTYSQAQHLRTLLLTAKRNHVEKKDEEKTLEQFTRWWLETIKRHEVRPITLSDYTDRYERYVKPTFGEHKLTSITSTDVSNWLHTLHGRDYSIPTIRGARQLLSMILDSAIHYTQLTTNPVSATKAPQQRTTLAAKMERAWTKDEAFEAITRSRGTQLHLAITLGITLGMRRSEIAALQWADFDFDAGTVEIQRGVREHRQATAEGTKHVSLSISEPKTLSSHRINYLPPIVLSALLHHRDLYPPLPDRGGQSWVFRTKTGNIVWPTKLSHDFATFCERAKIRRIRFHDMRHTSAVLALTADVRIESVSQALGHSRIDTTKSIYAPFVPKLAEEHSRGISALLEEPAPAAHTPQLKEKNT
jgi:integrase